MSVASQESLERSFPPDRLILASSVAWAESLRFVCSVWLSQAIRAYVERRTERGAHEMLARPTHRQTLAQAVLAAWREIRTQREHSRLCAVVHLSHDSETPSRAPNELPSSNRRREVARIQAA